MCGGVERSARARGLSVSAIWTRLTASTVHSLSISISHGISFSQGKYSEAKASGSGSDSDSGEWFFAHKHSYGSAGYLKPYLVCCGSLFGATLTAISYFKSTTWIYVSLYVASGAFLYVYCIYIAYLYPSFFVVCLQSRRFSNAWPAVGCYL